MPPCHTESSRSSPTGLQGSESLDQIRGRGNGNGAQESVEVRLVVPAVEANLLRHTLGDVDEPRHQAEERLRASLRLLQGGGIEATGEVGDPDPIQAAQDALLESPADEVVIFEHADAQARWYEDGLFERAQETLEPPLRLVVVETAADSEDHVVEVEEAGAGTVDFDADKEVGSAYLPGLTPRRLRRHGPRRGRHDRRDRPRRRRGGRATAA